MNSNSVTVQLDGNVAVVEFARPPVNYFDVALIADIVDAYTGLDRDPDCRAIVLASSGRHFCAGADFGEGSLDEEGGHDLYAQAARLLEHDLPVVAAVQGAAIGGGLGLALTADFRVAAPSSRFVCNFARLGIHHGFGLTATLPPVVGRQRAMELLYTGGTAGGAQARDWGLCDALADDEDQLRPLALELARRIAYAAPLAVQSIRRTMRGHLAGAVRSATANELREQLPLLQTADFQEGVRAARDRRDPKFTGR